MALASRRPLGLLRPADPEEAALVQLFGTLAASPSVSIIAQSDLDGNVDLWVRLGDANEANEMALYDALTAYHATDGVTTPIDLHLVLADEPDSAFPGSLRVLYRRHT